MSARYSQRQIQAEFTHERLVMGKLFDFLLMTSKSQAENKQKLPVSKLSCIEIAQNLYMTSSTYKENSTFLYISFFTLLFSLFTL